MSVFYNLRIAEEKFLDYLTKKRRSNNWKSKVKRNLGRERVLTSLQKREIREFYQKYFKIDMCFPEFYTQKTGKFFKNYMADNVYYCKIDPYFNDWKAAAHLDHKCYYDKWYFKGINMPKTLAKRINGMWMIMENDEPQFASKEQVYELVSNYDCFAKRATLSVGGHGVYKIKKGTAIDEIAEILSKLGKEIIIQEAIRQSSEMAKLNAQSVNSVRVLSFLNGDGSVKIYSAIVRMGVNNAVVDNASSGGITCGIEPDGRLKSVAYAANGTRYDKHPNTGLAFHDIVVPNYNKIVSLAEKLHKDFPHFRLLSWDFAVDENNEPMLIEVNLCYGELDFHQLNNGPLFGEDTEKILDEVFAKK